MLVHFGIDNLAVEWPGAVVAIGTFDGLHLGHQHLIRTARDRAEEIALPLVVVTFDRHPAEILAPDRVPKAIDSLSSKIDTLQRLGVAAMIVLPFNAWLSRLPAERFLDEILVRALHARELVVGHDFAMGLGRTGTAAWLAERIPTDTVAPFEIEDPEGGHERVSSSLIRRAVEEGEMERAQRLLGRPFSIEGIVVGGQRLGRTLGYPTANLARSAAMLMPPNGIYAGTASTPFGDFATALAIGTRPTIGADLEKTIEAYLIDYPGTLLYGHPMRLHVQHHLRGEAQFNGLDELKSAMARDVLRTRELIQGVPLTTAGTNA